MRFKNLKTTVIKKPKIQETTTLKLINFFKKKKKDDLKCVMKILIKRLYQLDKKNYFTFLYSSNIFNYVLFLLIKNQKYLKNI